MYWNKNKKKYIAIIFGGILILVILCMGDYGIRYYNAPIEKDYKYIGTGMLVRLSDFTNGELVSVEMRGKTAHYIWGNQEDYIQGNVWVNGEKISEKMIWKYVHYLQRSANHIMWSGNRRRRVFVSYTSRGWHNGK